MSGSLRRIALTVEQCGRNGYAWLLIESAGGRVFVLKKADGACSSYMGALDAGYQELALLSACGLREQGLEHEQRGTPDPRRFELAELHDAL